MISFCLFSPCKAVSTSGSNTPPNLYETIDEIRTTVNAVHASLSTTSANNTNTSNENLDNGQQQSNNNSRSSLEDVCTGGATPSEDVTPTTSRFDIYDGPAEEPIYASIKKVLSHSLYLANEENREQENRESTEHNNNDDAGNDVSPEVQEHAEGDACDEDDDFDDGDDTAPLI